jgi:hypothetical protein
MPNQSLVPFSDAEIVSEFGELASKLVDPSNAKQSYPDDFKGAEGETDEERYLWIYSGRIKALASHIEISRLEIGFLIFSGNARGIFLPSNETSMEDYLEFHRGVSRELINQSKSSYMIWVKVRNQGIAKERIQGASRGQIDAIKDMVGDVESQKKKIQEEQARAAGSKSFRDLPQDKKAEVKQTVDKMCGEEIRKGAETILDLPTEEVRRMAAASGKRTDKPLIIIPVDSYDPSICQLSFKGGSVLLSEEHITAIKRGHVTYKFKIEGESSLLSEQELGAWIEEAL